MTDNARCCHAVKGSRAIVARAPVMRPGTMPCTLEYTAVSTCQIAAGVAMLQCSSRHCDHNRCQSVSYQLHMKQLSEQHYGCACPVEGPLNTVACTGSG